MLGGTTAQGNTCLHVASICGHEQFCTKSVSLRPSLLSDTNENGETPLLIAVKGCHGTLALRLLQKHLETNQKQALSQQDKDGFNVLHHAIRSDYRRRTYGYNFYRELALQLILVDDDESGHLSRAVNKHNESPIFMAVLRGFKDVYVELLKKLPSDESVYSGVGGYNALHAAVKYNEKGDGTLPTNPNSDSVIYFFRWSEYHSFVLNYMLPLSFCHLFEQSAFYKYLRK
jgi:ankyrin repeat protein